MYSHWNCSGLFLRAIAGIVRSLLTEGTDKSWWKHTVAGWRITRNTCRCSLLHSPYKVWWCLKQLRKCSKMRWRKMSEKWDAVILMFTTSCSHDFGGLRPWHLKLWTISEGSRFECASTFSLILSFVEEMRTKFAVSSGPAAPSELGSLETSLSDGGASLRDFQYEKFNRLTVAFFLYLFRKKVYLQLDRYLFLYSFAWYDLLIHLVENHCISRHLNQMKAVIRCKGNLHFKRSLPFKYFIYGFQSGHNIRESPF